MKIADEGSESEWDEMWGPLAEIGRRLDRMIGAARKRRARRVVDRPDVEEYGGSVSAIASIAGPRPQPMARTEPIPGPIPPHAPRRRRWLTVVDCRARVILAGDGLDSIAPELGRKLALHGPLSIRDPDGREIGRVMRGLGDAVVLILEPSGGRA